MSLVPRGFYSSTLDGNVQINGEEQLINSIEFEVNNCIKIGKDLYEAQIIIKDFLIHRYGENWFTKSAEAVIYIIENTYCRYFHKQMNQNL